MIEPTPPARCSRREPHTQDGVAAVRRPTARSTAVVVGAGVSGLLAACVLTECYDRVVVIDRDADRGLPDRGGVGASTPVAPAQPMPALGAYLLEELVPGLMADLVRRGARVDDVGRCFVTCVNAHRLIGCDTGLRSVSGGPRLLECALRDKVAEAGVEFLTPLFVLGLLFDEGEVAGVRVTACDDRGDHDITADLVVDASGRLSRSPLWLARGGWRAPPEQVQHLDLRCATRGFRLAGEHNPGWTALVQTDGRSAGVAAHDHDDEWTVSLFAHGGEAPPLDLEGFAAFAAALRRPELAELLTDLEPRDRGFSSRAVSNLWRRYDRLDRMPPGLVVMGRALACLDPSLGLDTTVSLSHAGRLRECLRECVHSGRPATGLGARFFGLAAADLVVPWALATPPPRRGLGGLLDAAVAPRRALRVLLDAHLHAICAVGSEDCEVAVAVLRVRHLLEHPASLVSPRLLIGTLRCLPHRLSRLGQDG